MHQEWILEEGARELVGPEQATVTTGGCIDKYLYIPGPYISSTFIPMGGEETEGGEREDLKPARSSSPVVTRRQEARSSHYSQFLKIPANLLRKPTGEPTRITANTVTDGEWMEKGQELKLLVGQTAPIEESEEIRSNRDHFYIKLEWRIKQVFGR